MIQAVTIWLIIMAVKIVLLSVVTFFVYAWDKRQAKRSGWRVPESRLHLLSLLGGWPGAHLAQGWLHHKSSKGRFQRIYYWTIAGHFNIDGGITFLVWYLSQPH